MADLNDETTRHGATFTPFLLLGVLLAALIFLTSSALMQGPDVALKTPPSVPPPAGTSTLLSPPERGGGAGLLDSRTTDDSMLDMLRLMPPAGWAGACRMLQLRIPFTATRASVPPNAPPSPSQTTAPPPGATTPSPAPLADGQISWPQPGAILTSDHFVSLEAWERHVSSSMQTALPRRLCETTRDHAMELATPPRPDAPATPVTDDGHPPARLPDAPATPVTDDGQPPAGLPPPPTDDTPAASATDDNEPISWEDVPSAVRKWRSWRHRYGELHLHAPDALGYQVPAYELFMHTWGYVPSETYHQALEEGDTDALDCQREMDELVISTGYHNEPILIHGILDSGEEGDELREQLIAWDFAYHPFLNPDPDLEEDEFVVDYYVSKPDRPDRFGDGRYDGLLAWEPEEDDVFNSRPWGVCKYREAEDDARYRAVYDAASERRTVELYAMTFEDTRAEVRGWGDVAWRPKDTRRSAREQLLHELSRNGESRTYWGTAKRNRKRNKKTMDAPSSAPSSQIAAASDPPAPLSPALRAASTPTSIPTPTSTTAPVPSMSPKAGPAARSKSNRRRRSRKSKPRVPSPFSSTTTSTLMQSAAATMGT